MALTVRQHGVGLSRAGTAFALSLAVHVALIAAIAYALGGTVLPPAPSLTLQIALAPAAVTQAVETAAATAAAERPAAKPRTSPAPASQARVSNPLVAALSAPVPDAPRSIRSQADADEIQAPSLSAGVAVAESAPEGTATSALAAESIATANDAAAQRGFIELHVLDWLARHKQYPRSAARAGIEGVVQVRFILVPDGRITERSIEHSSGARILDRAALELLARASPIPGLSQFSITEPIELHLPISYLLRRSDKA